MIHIIPIYKLRIANLTPMMSIRTLNSDVGYELIKDDHYILDM